MTVNPKDDLGNVQVDFVWGNFPLQPDELRGENTLDAELDNHVIATSGYANYPSFLPNYAGDGDTDPEVSVPNITKATEATALSRLTAAGLTATAGAVTTEGATASNEGKVASQTPAAGTVVNTGSAVTYSLYSLAPAAAFGPTDNWTIEMGGFYFNAETAVNDAVAANESAYKLVITGGNLAGEYTFGYHGLGTPPIGIAGAAYVEQISDGMGYPFMSTSGVHGAGNSSGSTLDAGIASIVAI